jgi:GTP cyclohydrolase III
MTLSVEPQLTTVHTGVAHDVHPRVAMRILRHSRIAVTMEIYAEAPSEATRDALRKLSDRLT